MLQSALGCRHPHLSRVFTINKRTYQVCLDCGKECKYSWSEMHATRVDNAGDPLESRGRVRRSGLRSV